MATQEAPHRYTGLCPFQSVLESLASEIAGKPDQFVQKYSYCDKCTGTAKLQTKTDASGNVVEKSLDCAK